MLSWQDRSDLLREKFNLKLTAVCEISLTGNAHGVQIRRLLALQIGGSVIKKHVQRPDPSI